MKPTITVAETTAPDGSTFRLVTHDGQFILYMDDREVMSTMRTHSELLLADIGCDFKKKRKKPRVLIGGLGLGYSLRRALELTGPGSQIVVAELLPQVIEWNKTSLNGLNDDIMADPRTHIALADVYDLIYKAATKGPKFDAILLDVDDGPSALIQPQNAQLYARNGLEELKDALTPGGRAAIWAAKIEPKLKKALGKAGFYTEEIPCAKHAKAKRLQHAIYLAARRDS